MASTKIDPITAVQDSIDSLALSLFEALRGVRDSVAPESLSASAPTQPKEELEPINSETARGELKQILTDGAPEGTEISHEYLNRAFDLLEPDYHAFVLSYLSGDEYSKELVERFRAYETAKIGDSAASSNTLLLEKNQDGNKDETKSDKAERKAAEPVIGCVGYKFRKLFDVGWFEGKVIEIRPLAGKMHGVLVFFSYRVGISYHSLFLEGGKDRRVIYTDGDMEDLSVDDLEKLAKLDPQHSVKRPRLSIKLKLNKSGSKSDDGEPKLESSSNNIPNIPKIPRTESEYMKLLHQYELERDTATTQQLAQNILAKSAEVDNLVAKLPGMDRTRRMQMDRIEELIDRNQARAKELEEAYRVATQRREDVRDALEKHTCSALGLD